MNDALKRLRGIALTFKINPEGTIANAAGVDTVIRVLTDVRRSFNGFVEVEFLKDERYRKSFEKNSRILEEFLKGFELLIVDVKFGSLQASVAPNVVELENPLFRDEVLEWKQKAFTTYKHDVFEINYQGTSEVKDILKKYTAEERGKIYKPVFDAMSGKHRIDVIDQRGKVLNVLSLPDELRRIQIVPPVVKEKQISVEKNVVGYFKVLTDGTTIELKKSNIKKVYDLDVLEHDTYPYKPAMIKFEERTFVLSQKLASDVRFEDNLYFISYPDLDLCVWGESREQAETAFSFAFNALYENYAQEDNTKLSEKAIALKTRLLSLISQVTNEA
jgi:hypothetical protein